MTKTAETKDNTKCKILRNICTRPLTACCQFFRCDNPFRHTLMNKDYSPISLHTGRLSLSYQWSSSLLNVIAFGTTILPITVKPWIHHTLKAALMTEDASGKWANFLLAGAYTFAAAGFLQQWRKVSQQNRIIKKLSKHKGGDLEIESQAKAPEFFERYPHPAPSLPKKVRTLSRITMLNSTFIASQKVITALGYSSGVALAASILPTVIIGGAIWYLRYVNEQHKHTALDKYKTAYYEYLNCLLTDNGKSELPKTRAENLKVILPALEVPLLSDISHSPVAKALSINKLTLLRDESSLFIQELRDTSSSAYRRQHCCISTGAFLLAALASAIYIGLTNFPLMPVDYIDGDIIKPKLDMSDAYGFITFAPLLIVSTFVLSLVFSHKMQRQKHLNQEVQRHLNADPKLKTIYMKQRGCIGRIQAHSTDALILALETKLDQKKATLGAETKQAHSPSG